MQLSSHCYTFDWRPNYPFFVTATRYIRVIPTAQRQLSSSATGFTAIFAHGTGFHKEQWEPTIRRLFDLSNTDQSFLIREAWSVECPNHGQSYLLNEKIISQSGYTLLFPWDEYTKALYWFLTQNKEYDFSTHRLVAVGHSMGAVCLTLTQSYPYPPKFEQIVLCEPMIVPHEFPLDHPLLAPAFKFVTSTEKRQDIWSNFDHLRTSFQSKRAFQAWDKQVLDIYLKYGFRELPTLIYPDKQGITLACPKSQEAACYRDRVTARRVFQFLPAICSQAPVHVIWGAIDDSVATEVKQLSTDPSTGRKMASIQRVEGVGHLIVQMAPIQLAEAIFRALSLITARSKL